MTGATKKAPGSPGPIDQGGGRLCESAERLGDRGGAMGRHRVVIDAGALCDADLIRALQFSKKGFASEAGRVGVFGHLDFSVAGDSLCHRVGAMRPSQQQLSDLCGKNLRDQMIRGIAATQAYQPTGTGGRFPNPPPGPLNAQQEALPMPFRSCQPGAQYQIDAGHD